MPFLALIEPRAAAGRTRGKIDRPQKPLLAFDEDQRVLLVERMIAERDRVRAGIQKLLEDVLGDAEAAGRVLAIDDDEVELVALSERRQHFDDGLAAGASDHVSEEKKPH